ncbi:MAG: DUF6799 domain-containing protein [Bacteroidota bacterium]
MKKEIAAVFLLAILAGGAFYGLDHMAAGTGERKNEPAQMSSARRAYVPWKAVSRASEDSILPVKDLPEKYCARMKEAMLVVVYEGKEIIEDVKLPNGITIRPDGSVVQEDGTLFMLKAGECIDKAGNLSPEKPGKPKKPEPEQGN